jgi:DUF971 family protein
MASAARPLEIRNHLEEGWLEIAWSDGVTAVLPHRLLREACRCAHCQAAARAGEAASIVPGIRLHWVEPYGSNSLRLGFDDGHSRGLYPFSFLRELPAGRRSQAPSQQLKVLANPSSSSAPR